METSADFPASFYRVTVKGMCVRDGKVLLVREAESLSGKWELPGGGLDFGEDIRVGFEREVAEEMGLKISRMAKSPTYVWPYKYEHKRGMAWFYSLVVAYQVDFEHLEFTKTPECEEIGFFSNEEMRELRFAGQLRDFADIFDPADFTPDF